MKRNEINIRDPFVLFEDGRYYMYGTRAKNFGEQVGGFDVYVSADLEIWSDPIPCFDSERFHLNHGSNWAPEVHKYCGEYYMFATFVPEGENRGTYILKADSPLGPFVPHSHGAVTPKEWGALDGTLYVNKERVPYVVFCHEHTQIIDGTVCYARLSDDLTTTVGEPVTLFAASQCPWADGHKGHYETEHYVTDGPFLYRTKDGALLMIWSSFIREQYAELVVRFKDGELGTEIEHLKPLIDNDGGHGMIFEAEGKKYFVFHTPNKSGYEHPAFLEISDDGTSFSLK